MNPVCAVFYVFLATQTSLISSDKGAFSYVLTSTVDTLYGVRLESTVPAVDLALDYINNNSSLLPGLNLTYNTPNRIQCSSSIGSSLEDLVTDLNYAILGYSCSVEPRSGISEGRIMSNFTPMVQYTPTSTDFLFNDSDSDGGQRAIFNIHPPPDTYAQVLTAILRQFDWQRLLIITGRDALFEDILQKIQNEFQRANMTLLESLYNGRGNLTTIPPDIRIIFLNMNSFDAVDVMCQAYTVGMLFPRYIWITYYATDFQALSRNFSTCSSGQMSEFLDGVFNLLPTASTGRSDTMFAEISKAVSDLEDAGNFSPLSYYAIDAILVLAQAINDTLAGWSNNSPDWSFCELENQVNKTSLSKCFVRQKLMNLNISGLTGEITFDAQGKRVTNIIGIHQYRNQVRELVAQVTVIGNATELELLNNENETSIFRGPVPSDGTPIKNINIQPLGFVIVYYILASLGLVFSIICFLFNIVFRKRKMVKLISPNLNYFITTGAVLLYSSIFFRIFPSASYLSSLLRCNMQTYLTCVGYMLCFAPILMKMWRVFYIFHNPSPKKKAIKDWQLLLGAFIIVSIILLICILQTAIPPLRPVPMLIPDIERPTGVTEDGITINNCIYQCYGFSYSLLMVGLEYAYLLIIQVAAFILAIITRKVKIKALNDSKAVAIIVYVTSTILLFLGIFTFALGTRLILNEVLFSGGIMMCTTVLLSFVFIPKMVDLYKDPRGEGIFGKDTTNTMSTQNNNLGLSGTFSNSELQTSTHPIVNTDITL